MKQAQPYRPSQTTPEDLVARLLAFIRTHFYAEAPRDKFYQDRAFLKRNVICWPARFINGKGFTMPADQYEKVLLTIFRDVMSKGKTQAVKFWPGYLMKCVQEHYEHHWEDYQKDSKAFDNLLLTSVANAKQLSADAQARAQDQTVTILASAHAVLTDKRRPAPGRSVPVARSGQKQLSLFGL